MNYSQAIKVITDYAGQEAERAYIEAICKLAPSDRLVLEAARVGKLRDQPRANKHLDHYLMGGGKDLEVDTKKLLDEDSGVRWTLTKGVLAQLKEGKQQGFVPIAQNKYANIDWKNALGGINLYWKSDGEVILVNFVNVYRWHPEDTRRTTNCVHKAADRLKKEGARDYRMVGTNHTIQIEEITGQKPINTPYKTPPVTISKP
jgi:hypothetical protein